MSHLEMTRSNKDDDEQPARKRRKLSIGSTIGTEGDSMSWSDNGDTMDPNHFSMQKILAEEFDLEISLRQRMAGMIEARITLALLLRDCLSSPSPSPSSGIGVSYNFQDIANETWRDIQTPCDIIFGRGTNFVPSVSPGPNQHNIPQPIPNALPARISSYRTRDRTLPRTPASSTKLLFIRDNSRSPPIVAKMACPDCSRDDFTNIQGLLNHCRIRHSKDYGSHDECMQRCAVIVPDEDRDWIVSNGTELSGISLPSLRRLFEIAVGNDTLNITASAPVIGCIGPQESPAPATLMSRTLGHHKDTPALAPLLGYTPKRRCINVHNESDYVDIGDRNDCAQAMPLHTKWRMPYAHRSEAMSTLDIALHQGRTEAPPSTERRCIPDATNSGGTRFHVVARVIVSDRSLWLGPGRLDRSYPAHTHRWMLSVDSASYSLHITAFLSKVSMTCLTEPSPCMLSTAQSLSTPPFTFVGTTDKPFLACLTFEWTGSHNPPLEVQHWVELDLGKAANPVLGDEQMLDVELDRNTELLPVNLDFLPPSWEKTVNSDERPRNDAPSMARNDTEPAYSAALRNLISLVPMTLKDVKSRPSSHSAVPYRLAANPTQFRALVLGRRKAIEWQRAKSLLAEYQKHMASSASGDLVPLTTADVYCWMLDEGFFLRDTPQILANPKAEGAHTEPGPSNASSAGLFDSAAQICPDCGLWHGTQSDSANCPYVRWRIRKLPMMDLSPILSVSPAVQTPKHYPIVPTKTAMNSYNDLVSMLDPTLIMALRDIVDSLMLTTFRSIRRQSSVFPLDELGASAAEIEKNLAPFAVLSIATRTFLSILIKGGLHIAHRDWAINDGGWGSGGIRVLTPSHVVRGMYSSSHTEMRAVLACCLRVRLPFAFPTATNPSGHTAQND